MLMVDMSVQTIFMFLAMVSTMCQKKTTLPPLPRNLTQAICYVHAVQIEIVSLPLISHVRFHRVSVVAL